MSKFNDLFIDDDLLFFDHDKFNNMLDVLSSNTLSTIEDKRNVKYITEAPYLDITSLDKDYQYACEGVIGDIFESIGRFFVLLGEFIAKSILSVIWPFGESSSNYGGGDGTYTNPQTNAKVNIKDVVNEHGTEIINKQAAGVEFPKHLLLNDKLVQFNKSILKLITIIFDNHKPVLDIFSDIVHNLKSSNVDGSLIDKLEDYKTNRPGILKSLIDNPDMLYLGITYDTTRLRVDYAPLNNTLPFTDVTTPCSDIELKNHIATLYDVNLDKEIKRMKDLNTKTLSPMVKDISKGLVTIGKSLSSMSKNTPSSTQQVKFDNLRLMQYVLGKCTNEVKSLTTVMRNCVDTLTNQKKIMYDFVKKLAPEYIS